MSTIFEIIALVGVTNIITRSFLLQPVRDMIPWQKVKYAANCPQCSGFWVGLLYYVCILSDYNAHNYLAEAVLWGAIVSLASSFVVAVLDYLSFAKSHLLESISGVSTLDLMNDDED